MGRPADHHLIVTDRGATWKRRFLPSCSCGEWTGLACRRGRHCALAHNEHLDNLRRADDVERRKPRPVTPAHLLPAALRPARAAATATPEPLAEPVVDLDLEDEDDEDDDPTVSVTRVGGRHRLTSQPTAHSTPRVR